MDRVEAEGSSIDEAIELALQRLGVTRDRVEVEILHNATRGLFGIGGRKAKVRATLRTALKIDLAPEPASRDAAPAAPAPERRPRRAPAAPAQRKRPAPGADTDLLGRAHSVLQDLVRLMGSEATVEVADEPDAICLRIAGDVSGTLIGRRGQTLDALEYLVNRIVSREDENLGRVVVDSQGYRARRRQALEELARRLAERARQRGKPVTLNPLSPRDRRIVHLALQGDPSLVTRSSGKGYFRKLLIIPEASRAARRPSKSHADPHE